MRRFKSLRLTSSSIRHSLLRYFINIDDAIEDRHINDNAMMVKLAKSNLAGRVKTWLSGLKFHGSSYLCDYIIFYCYLCNTLSHYSVRPLLATALADILAYINQ